MSVTGFRLPAQMTSFVGRDEDLAAAAQAVTEARLVTLTGVGGVGKTRLALRTAAATAARFADGLCWCELAPVTDPDAVAPAVATALGVHRGPAATVVESVVTFLGDQQRLLILDNCEHLLGGVRPLVSELLRGCPRLVVLATSRAKLGINGERVRPVAPLPLPSASSPRRDEPSPAVRLFVERARAVRPDLRLDQATRDEIGTICRHLDGLPLALELAAARMRSLNPADISDRMRSDLDLLSSGDEQSDRHGSLRAVLDWSYGLLTTEQRQLFDRLSVFAGSFDLAAAEEVCAGRGIERSRVVDLLTSLVDASMIAVGGTEGAIRYSLLETLRRYGAEHCGDSREADADPACTRSSLCCAGRPGRPRAARARGGALGGRCRPGPRQSSSSPSMDASSGPGRPGAATRPRPALLHALSVSRRGRGVGRSVSRPLGRRAASALRRGLRRRRGGPDRARGDGSRAQPRHRCLEPAR